MIYIDIEKPERCLDCPFRDMEDNCVILDEMGESYGEDTFEEMYANCPCKEKAISAEPCEEAISRKNLIAKIEDIYSGNMLYECGCCPQDFVDIAKESPTVQPKEKVGEWKEEITHIKNEWDDFEYDKHTYRCTNCEGITHWIKNKKFCPNCGAKMKGEKE